jgi:hypothetical protein
MFVEHQSTSGTKIESLRGCTRAVMPDFRVIDFTGLIVKRRRINAVDLLISLRAYGGQARTNFF